MPNNFASIGLISLILPNARIVATYRDPMDTCWSCYKQLFARGQSFTYDLVGEEKAAKCSQVGSAIAERAKAHAG